VHPGYERVTVLSGTIRVTLAGEADGVSLGAGSYFSLPPGTAHTTRIEEPAVLQISGMGPWGVVFVEDAGSRVDEPDVPME
jgi:quercetin dioxygenase-like cupin family protein